MQKILLLVFLLAASINCMSQLDAQRTFSYGGKTLGRQITIQIPGDGCIIFTNYTNRFSFSNTYSNDSTSLLILRLNNTFDTIWSKRINQFVVADAIMLKDGNLLLTGALYKQVTFVTGTDLSFIKVSPAGNILLQKAYNFKDSGNGLEYPYTSATTVELKNGQIFVLAINWFNNSPLPSISHFLRLNAQLSLLTARDLGLNRDNYQDNLLKRFLINKVAIGVIDTNRILIHYDDLFNFYGNITNNRIIEVDTNMTITMHKQTIDSFTMPLKVYWDGNKYFMQGVENQPPYYSVFSMLDFNNGNNFKSIKIRNLFKNTNVYALDNTNSYYLNKSIYTINELPRVGYGFNTQNTIYSILDSGSYNVRLRILKVNPDLSVSWYKRLHTFGFTTNRFPSNEFNYQELPGLNQSSLSLQSDKLILTGNKNPLHNYISDYPSTEVAKKETGILITQLDTSGIKGNCNLTEEKYIIVEDSLRFGDLPLFAYSPVTITSAPSIFLMEAFAVTNITDTCLPLKKPVSKFGFLPQNSTGNWDSIVCNESAVSFFENSYNEPRDWKWVFPPEADLSLIDTSNYPEVSNIKFPKAGTFPVKLITTNSAGSDTLIRYVNVINFIPQPDLGNDTALCQGDSLKIIYRNPPNSKHYFFSNDVPNMYTESDTLVIKENGNYICAAYTSCGFKYDTIAVKFNNRAISFFSHSHACNLPLVYFRDSSLLNGNISSGHLWKFFNNANQQIGSGTQQNPQFLFPSFDSFFVRLILSTSNNCPAYDSVTKRIYIKPPPTATFSTADTCTGSTIRLQNNSTGNIIGYKWLFGNGDSSTAALPVYAYPAAGNYTIRLTIATADNCTASATLPITINPNPVAAFSITESCLGKAISITNSSSGSISNYNWRVSDGQNFTTANPVILFNSEGSYNLQLKVQTVFGCSDSITKPIIINAVKITVTGDTSIITNQPLQLTANGAATYLWQPAGNLNNANSSNPVFKTANSGVYPLVVQGTTAQGCKGTAAINITVYNIKAGLILPNAFSPNGDNLNDVFRLNCTGLQSLSFFRIFNRYGQVIYEQQTCSNAVGWDGKYKGKTQNPGAYIYVWQGVDFNGEGLNGKGTVMLLR